MIDDLRALIEQLKDRTPAWLTAPIGNLRVSDWIDQGKVYVLDLPPFGKENEEPLVLMHTQDYDWLRHHEPIAAFRLTDKQIAGFFVEQAREERMMQ